MVETGEISPEDIDVPSMYVQRVLKGEYFEKRIEVRSQCMSRCHYGVVIAKSWCAHVQ